MRCAKLLVLLGALVLLTTLSVQAKEYRFTQSFTFDPDQPVTLALTFVTGSVTVTGGDGDVIAIDVEKTVDAVGMDQAAVIADHIKIRSEESDDRIELTTAYLKLEDYAPSFWDKLIGAPEDKAAGEVAFTIRVPEQTSLDVTSTTGPITIRNLIGDVTIAASEGEIELNSIEGAIEIDNGTGSTHGEMLFGPMQIRQPLGEVTLRWVEGDIRLKSLSAAIDIQQEAGALDIVTRTGAVTIRTNLESRRDFFVETQSGNIEFLVPLTASGLLHISSDMGEIQTDVPISVEKYSREGIVGRFGRGGVRINLVSGSGDVTVAQF
ncbi:DUF4097 family beta strand repeat protein [candidate division GN15 bacterium]|nr:DUF4097 family beta strand repeat protein [candidate division GN15 bacterium]